MSNSEYQNDFLKRALVAAVPEGQARAQQALAKNYELCFASTLREAQQLLFSVAVDIIIIGIHFDESRGLDLLRFVKKTQGINQLPVLLMQECDSALHHIDSTMEQCGELLGACELVKLSHLDANEADAVLASAVEGCLQQPRR